jgi:hypothetical protein
MNENDPEGSQRPAHIKTGGRRGKRIMSYEL